MMWMFVALSLIGLSVPIALYVRWLEDELEAAHRREHEQFMRYYGCTDKEGTA